MGSSFSGAGAAGTVNNTADQPTPANATRDPKAPTPAERTPEPQAS